MKKPAYDISLLTPQEKLRLGINQNSSNLLGVRGDSLLEPVCYPEKAKSEVRLFGPNNHMISLIRDTPRDLGSGYGAQTGAGSIELVAGFSSADPSQTLSANPQGTRPDSVTLIRNYKDDASRLLISQKTDVDDNFELVQGNIGIVRAKAAVAVKSDSLRLIGREGIKIITGGDSKNSAGAEIRSVPRINIIAGNDDTDLQPVAKADTLNLTLQDIFDQIDKLNSVLDTFMTAQIEFNTAVMTHDHFDLPVMTVGTISSGNPFAINGGRTGVSPDLIPAGSKMLSSEYVAKIDGIVQKLQTSITQFNNTDASGPKNNASPSVYTT
tara:strand:- start:31 stop:1005 length:975 start_codon:yes stop_codon:yes gene_type:complete